MSKHNDKLSKTEKGVVAIIIVTMLAVFALAFTAEPSDNAPKHGSYAKCEQYGVKGFCVRWSVATY